MPPQPVWVGMVGAIPLGWYGCARTANMWRNELRSAVCLLVAVSFPWLHLLRPLPLSHSCCWCNERLTTRAGQNGIGRRGRMSGMPQVQELMRSAKDTCTNTSTTRYDVKEALSGDGRSTRSDGRSDSGGVAKRPSHATLRPSLRHVWENAQATVPHDPQSLRHPSAVFRGCRRSSPLSVHGSGKRIKCDREFIRADLVSSYRADNGIIRIGPLNMSPHWRGHP